MNPLIPPETTNLLHQQGLPKKRVEWLMRHLEHYLSRHPLDEALSPDHAVAYVHDSIRKIGN
jgi:hypothetical protein